MGVFRQKQAGQILLIVVLAAVVSLTVGLSAVSRTITNTRVTTEEANSQKALSAAEAGIEELVNNSSLLATGGLSKDLSNNARYDATAQPVDGTQFLINDGNLVLKDDGADIWLSDYPNFDGTRWSGNLSILWDNNDGCGVSGSQEVAPAIEVVIIQGDNRDSPNMIRQVFDPCGRINNSSFSNLSVGTRTISARSQAFDYGVTVNIPAFPQGPGFIARVVPLFANGVLGVRGSVGLPSQGFVIDSVGSSGNTKRTIRVFRGFPKVPIEYFPYNIFLP